MMAGSHYSRTVALVAGALVCLTVTSPTFATTASNFTVVSDQTTCSTDWPTAVGNVLVVSVMGYADGHAFDLRAAPEPVAIKREFHAFKQPQVRPTRFGQAVRPSAVAGWRSGRVRHLAAA